MYSTFVLADAAFDAAAQLPLLTMRTKADVLPLGGSPVSTKSTRQLYTKPTFSSREVCGYGLNAWQPALPYRLLQNTIEFQTISRQLS